MRRIITVLLLLATAGMVLLTLAADVFCKGTLHVPRKTKAMPRGSVIWEDVSMAARDGVILRGSFAAGPGTAGGCVMVLHGIADTSASAAGFAPMFLEAGYAVLAPDSRAHGHSGGELVTYGLLERYDVLAWAHWLRQRGCTRIFGLGESLGAAVLVQAAAVEPAFRAIAAECSYADLRSVGTYRVRRMAGRAAPLAGVIVSSAIVYARLRYGLDFNDASPETYIARTSSPILLIHGLADFQTPAVHSERLAKANSRAMLWLVPGADHVQASTTAPKEFQEKVLGWFAQHR